MDSLKLPNAGSANSSASGSNSNLSGSTSGVGGSSTSPTATKSPPGLNNSTPISVRFNANEESLDDILQSFHHSKHSPNSGAGDVSPTMLGGVCMKNGSMAAALGLNAHGNMVGGGDSLSTSPSQQQAAVLFGNDEVNLRNNFLQGGFFNRKRSGSSEGVSPTTIGPNLIATLSSSVNASGATAGVDHNVAPVGTWKLIKGKVSQTIEDIKSSKHQQHHHTPAIPIIVADAPGIAWCNEPDSDTECITLNTSISEELPLDHEKKEHNSDSDMEAELLQHDSSSVGSADAIAGLTGCSTSGNGATIERSRLRRGLAHIKSKVKAKQQPHHAMGKKDVSPSGNATSSGRAPFLQCRNYAENTNEATCEAARPKAAKIPIARGKAKRGIVLARKDVEIESGVEVLEDMVQSESAQPDGGTKNNPEDKLKNSRVHLDLPLEDLVTASTKTQANKLTKPAKRRVHFGSINLASVKSWTQETWLGLPVHQPPIVLLAVFIGLLLLPMNDFLRGVLATLVFIMLIETSSTFICWAVEHFLLKIHPERTPFQVPDYTTMPICEIPAAEEHKTIKAYSGWLNEANSYDPITFSFSLTRSVYVRLDGTALKMSGTDARIPKRRMWNEPPIDRNKVLFTDHRSYDLRDCRIELLPVGLAKKRFFNRKYPIQLIIQNKNNEFATPQSSSSSTEVSIPLESKEGKTNIVNNTKNSPPSVEESEKAADFAATVMQANLQELRNTANPDTELKDISVPCGDEVRLLLFARCDREKEDWYRRFQAASKGRVHEQDLQVPQLRFVDDGDLQAAAAKQAILLTNNAPVTKARYKELEKSDSKENIEESGSNTPDVYDELGEGDSLTEEQKDITFEGLIMSSDVARNPADYVRFMSVYQQACNQSHIPVRQSLAVEEPLQHVHRRKNRRHKRQEDELWKGIDQSLFLGPSGSVVWANVLVGRCLFSCLHDTDMNEKVKDILQKKLNSIKLPSFMEEVVITNIYFGKSPMLVHRVSQPMVDERGVWLDADITYEGLGHITVTTKLNLLRVRAKPKASPNLDAASSTEAQQETRNLSEDHLMDPHSSSCIYDSDAESCGGSSTESEETAPPATSENVANNEFFQNSPGNARRIFKLVDRIATSNLFQYASELPYVQRAMENMNANITLRVELKGMVARGTLNVPPPPSDRIWVSFRGPPRLWISTKPQVGDKSVDWSIVTNVIESKLCEAVNKFLVYPNMVDFNIPFLANPSYEDEPPAPSN